MDEGVAIIGSGGIGGFLAGELVDAGRDVTLCVRTPFDRLTVESGGRSRDVDVRQVAKPEDARPAPWILLTTKSQDTASAKPWVDALGQEGTRLVMVQNGIGHLERAATVTGGAAGGLEVVPAIIYCSVERDRPGHVVHHGAARLVVPAGKAGRDLASLFEGTTFQVEQEADFKTAAWRKLLSNLAANSITALTLRRVAVFREPAVLELARAIQREAIAVAQADGATLTEADSEKILSNYGTVIKPTGGTSMLYDRLAERPLEHDHITGALVAAADRHGVPVPVNRTILALLGGASGHPLDGSE